MRRNILLKISICILSFASVIYAYLEDQNEVISLSMMVPSLERQLLAIQEENTRLRYEIERFESPSNLMQLAKHCEFSHLHHPYSDDIICVTFNSNDFFMPRPQNANAYETFSLESQSIVVGALPK
ncbi:MAG: hypothetical protein K9M07_04310 [Simkaniaceae bacterium]|nr:hypothetical protein [Simkaniaceae bacterium]MCF7852447.1 hypothetical protein [Simkaniaceae bacterium]